MTLFLGSDTKETLIITALPSKVQNNPHAPELTGHLHISIVCPWPVSQQLKHNYIYMACQLQCR